MLGGLLVGLLYAPSKGTELRKKIKDKYCDLKGKGCEAIDTVNRQGHEIFDMAVPAIEQVKEESKTLKVEGKEIARSTSASLQEALQKSQTALGGAQERIASSAAPAIEQVKKEGQELKEQGAEILRNASENFKGAKEKGMSALDAAQRKAIDVTQNKPPTF